MSICRAFLLIVGLQHTIHQRYTHKNLRSIFFLWFANDFQGHQSFECNPAQRRCAFWFPPHTLTSHTSEHFATWSIKASTQLPTYSNVYTLRKTSRSRSPFSTLCSLSACPEPRAQHTGAALIVVAILVLSVPSLMSKQTAWSSPETPLQFFLGTLSHFDAVKRGHCEKTKYAENDIERIYSMCSYGRREFADEDPSNPFPNRSLFGHCLGVLVFCIHANKDQVTPAH